MPLEFLPGESAATHGLTGRESYDVEGLADGLAPGKSRASSARVATTGS
jgi:aconitate hydratase